MSRFCFQFKFSGAPQTRVDSRDVTWERTHPACGVLDQGTLEARAPGNETTDEHSAASRHQTKVLGVFFACFVASR